MRNKRHEALEKIALQVGAQRIALAHHSLDQAETVLMRLLGGGDLRGLVGMRPVRSSLWVRPMLNVTREEIEDEARGCRLAYVHDSSNFMTHARRNYLRQVLIPTVRAHVNPQIVRHLCELGDSISYAVEFLENEARKVLPKARMTGSRFKVQPLRDSPVAVRRIGLQLLFQEVAGDGSALRRPQLKQLEHLLMTDDGERTLSLPRKVRALRAQNWLLLARRD
jgi:tRNA(Ile)-lysidine synthase